MVPYLLLYLFCTTISSSTANRVAPNITYNDTSEEMQFAHGKCHLAYNCNIRDNLAYNQFSLLEVKKCDNVSSIYNPSFKKSAQLIQRKRIQTTQVLHCSLLVSLMTSYCSTDVFSGARQWDSNNLLTDVQLRLSKSECSNALKDNILQYQDRLYYGSSDYITISLPQGGRASGWQVLRGKIYPSKGTCEGDSFSINNRLFSSHTLSMRYTINIQYVEGKINVRQEVMRVDGFIITDLKANKFFHPDLGNFHWNFIDSNLTSSDWLEISKGHAEIFKANNSETQAIAYIKTNESRLAMTLGVETDVCLFHTCRTAFSTNLQDVYLVLHDNGQNYWNLDTVSGTQISRLAQFQAISNSVFISQEINLSNSFDRISNLFCQKSREIITGSIDNFLENTVDHMNEKVFIYKQGSVIYSFSCKNQVIWLAPQNDSRCYENPRIIYKNSNNKLRVGYVNPTSWVILNESKVITCPDILQYKIGLRTLDFQLEWLCRSPTGSWSTDCNPPQIVSPLHPGKLYKTKMSLIHTNLYTEKQINDLENAQWSTIENKVLINELEEILQNGLRISPGSNIEDLLRSLISKTSINSQGLLENHYVYLFEKYLYKIIQLWYVLNILTNLCGTLRQIRKIYTTKNFNLKTVFSLIIQITRILCPLMNENKHRCPCMESDFKDTLYAYVELQEREKFLKHLQM